MRRLLKNDPSYLMTPIPSSPAVPPPMQPASPAPPPPAKKRRWFLYGCGSLLALVLLIILTVVITIWWIQRPIKPVVLTAKEKATVEKKLQRLEGRNSSGPVGERGANVNLGPLIPEHSYPPGSKTLQLTEREINGLLH